MFGTAGIYTTSKKDIFSPDFKSQYNINGKPCNTTSGCGGLNEICNIGECECVTNYERNYENGFCEICPTIGDTCRSCCRTNELVCVDGVCQCDYSISSTCSSYGAGVFVTASQVALSAALIMGIAALAMVVYRLCTRPKYLSARHRAALARSRGEHPDNDPANNIPYDARASLSSMQIQVINRLRDRPPTYEGANNNNNNTRDRSSNTSSLISTGQTTITTLSNNNNNNNNNNSMLVIQRNVDAPPPPYIISENPLELELHRPPPYTEIILCPAGYLNESYTNTEDSLNADGTPRINNNNGGNGSNISINISGSADTNQKEHNENGVVNNNNSEIKNKENDSNKNIKKINVRDNNNNNDDNSK